jgi:type IV pilus assembly protein PilO
MTLHERWEKLQDDLRGLDGHNLGSWPLWVRVACTAALAVVIIAAGSWYFVRPKVHMLHAHQHKEAHLKHEFKIKQDRVANLGAYKKQLGEMQHSFAKLLRQLPSKKEEADLLNDISRARVASGLEQKLFKPQSEKKEQFYAALPIEITVVGTYHEMNEFVSRVSALSRIVTLQFLDIKPVKDTAHNDALRMHLKARTFRYLDDDGHSEGKKR